MHKSMPLNAQKHAPSCMEACFSLIYMLDSMGKSPCKRASSHPEIQELLAFEITLQMVIHMDGAYTDGCSCIEHVARLQREETADVADELVHFIQHVGRIARLHRLSVDVEMEGQPVPQSIQVFS